ncbi:MAG: hypothetical protein ACOYJ1_13285 [Peptococcales bacterium]|jgi:hypothetical protein
MQFPKGSGLEAIDKTIRRSLNYYNGVLKRYNAQIKTGSHGQSIIHALEKGPQIKLPSLNDLKRPVESFVKSLSDIAAQIVAKPEKIDYNAVVNSFLPPGARLLKPEYPENSGEIQFADLDGDNRNELVASYITSDGIRTIILKKDNVQWYKMAEISNPEFESIHYRNTANLGGDGKKHLVLGLVSKQKNRTLFAYSVTEGSSKKIFSRTYDKLEFQKTRIHSGRIKDAIAFWDEKSQGIYDIELLHWNGIDLENLNISRYMSGKVVPYYISKLRNNPRDTVNWYSLAKSLSIAGDTERAARAVDIGLRYNPDDSLKDRFNELKSRL